MTTPVRPAPAWGVVIPVKRRPLAKSRLDVAPGLRAALVQAFFEDTVAAVRGASCVAAVLVVTDDLTIARAAAELGVDAIPDGRPGDLNGSVHQGAAELLRRSPGLGPVALCADLPCLRSEDLDRVWAGAVAGAPSYVVSDAAGTGTTMYAATTWEDFRPSYGEESRLAHVSEGAVDLSDLASPGLRRDVDTLEDLRAALALGVGPATARALA